HREPWGYRPGTPTKPTAGRPEASYARLTFGQGLVNEKPQSVVGSSPDFKLTSGSAGEWHPLEPGRGRPDGTGRSNGRVSKRRLHEPPQRPIARVLDVGFGEAPAHAAVLLQDVRGGDAQLALVVLQELLPQRRVPEHHVLAVLGRHPALEVVVHLL